LARPRERGLKPERGAERAAAERSGAALIIGRRNSAVPRLSVRAGRKPESMCACGSGQVGGTDDGPVPGEFGAGLDDEAELAHGKCPLGQH
jgi:hypothetical protein